MKNCRSPEEVDMIDLLKDVVKLLVMKSFCH